MDIEQRHVAPVYSQIAGDLARRVVEGDFVQGDKLYGRSLMSSEYGVSPETIRRAFRLLANMKVIAIKPQSCAVVVSVDSAKRYLAQMEELESKRSLQNRLQELVKAQNKIATEFYDVASEITKRNESLFSAMEQGFGVGEVKVAPNAWVIGKSIGQLAFWQATGATVLAIRRGKNLIISPGPYAELYQDDGLLFVAKEAQMDSVEQFVNRSGENAGEGI